MASDLSFSKTGIHILVVDDDSVQLKSVSAILNDSGFKVSTAENGQIAYEKLKSGEKIDLVLSDVMMPIMSGPEFLTKARQDKLLKELPIVMMSSNDQYDIVFDCLSKGADDYIIKPMTKQVLSNIYANVFTKRRENEAIKKMEQQQLENAELEQKVNEMKKKFSEAIKTPINEVISSLESLLSKNILSQEATLEVQKIINNSKVYNSGSSFTINNMPTNVSKSSTDFFMSQFGGSTDFKEARRPVKVIGSSKLRSPTPSIPLYNGLKLPEEQLLSLDFDVWNLDIPQILDLCYDIFNFHDVKKKLNCKDGELELFMKKVSESYKLNPFNNIRRSADCLHFVSAVLKRMPGIFTDSEIVGVLFAAFMLDVGHSGTNNYYHIITSSRESLCHNNRSVNESNSASKGSMILNEVFSSSVDYVKLFEVRKVIMYCILKTDSAKVCKFLDKIRQSLKSLCLESSESNAEEFEFDWSKDATRKRALQLLILMGDNSFAIKKWDTTRFWYRVMRDEQMLQGNLMKKMGFAVDKHMDRNQQSTDSEVLLLHFNTIVAPVFRHGCLFFKCINIEVMKNTEMNLQKMKLMGNINIEDPN